MLSDSGVTAIALDGTIESLHEDQRSNPRRARRQKKIAQGDLAQMLGISFVGYGGSLTSKWRRHA